jgi:hypothetical protein
MARHTRPTIDDELIDKLLEGREHSAVLLGNDVLIGELRSAWPTYPGRFRDAEHAMEWGREFFPAYSRKPHEGLALFTLDDVYTGQVDARWKVRQEAMDLHCEQYPKRYVNGRAIVHRPLQSVYINPDDGLPGDIVLADPTSFAIDPTPASIELPEVVT